MSRHEIAPPRPDCTVLLVDGDHPDLDGHAHELARAGLRVFWTREAEVALRLSQEIFFHVVMLDPTCCDNPNDLAECLARTGHRCIIFEAGGENWPPLGGKWHPAILGALRRPVDPRRFAALVDHVAAEGDVEAFQEALDLY